MFSLSKLCNLLKKRFNFFLDCRIAELKQLYKKGSKTGPKIYRPVSLYHSFQKLKSNQAKTILNKNKI